MTVGTRHVSVRTERQLVIACVLLAALLRSWDLDLMSIWQDEGLSLYRSGLSLTGILGGVIPLGELTTYDVHPPLYFLLLAAWRQLGGWLDGADAMLWAVRWLSLMASLPAIPLIWALGRRLVGAWTGLVAALLAALSPLYLWYSQEVRSYSLVVTLSVAAVYLLARAVEPGLDNRQRIGPALGAAAASAALVWTHYLGFLVVAFEALVLMAAAARSRGRGAVTILVAMAAAGAAAVPLLPFAMWRLGIGAERDQHFVPLDTILADVVRGFGLGRTFYHEVDSTAGRVSVVAMAVFAALLVVGALHAWRRDRASAAYLAGYLLAPVVGLYLLTLVKPVYLGSYHLIAASPAFYVLVGAGVAGLGARRVAVGALACAAALAPMLVADANFYDDPRYHKDDLRALAAYVDARAVPGDVLVLSDPVLERSFEHISRHVPVLAQPALLASGLPDDRPPAERLAPLLAEHGRLWFMKPLAADREWLLQNALLVDREDFRGAGIPVYVMAFQQEELPSITGARPATDGSAGALGSLTLQSWDVTPEPLRAGQGARVALAWETPTQSTGGDSWLPDYKVAVRLLDESGRSWADGDHEPFHGERPTSTWPAGTTVYEPHDLLVYPATPPGLYRLAVTVYDPATGAEFPAAGPLLLGDVEVGRSDEPIDPHDVPVAARVWYSGAGVTVFGYDLAAEGAVAGGEMPVTFWLVIDDPHVATSVAVELLDGRSRVLARSAAAIEGAPPKAEAAPAPALLAGDIRRASPTLTLPAEGGRFSVRLVLLDGDGHRQWMRRGPLPLLGAWLGELSVEAPTVDSSAVYLDAPDIEHRYDVPVGEGIVLVGADLAPIGDSSIAGGSEVAPSGDSTAVVDSDLVFAAPSITAVRGEQLPVTLYWQATDAVPTSYHVTVQVVPAAAPGGGSATGRLELAPAGPPVAQHDGAPSGGARPTTSWRPGETIVDEHQLALPRDLEPGTYLLIAALYAPEAPGRPRPVAEQEGRRQDYVRLAVIEVE
ncbi:MAG: glycosyltransferase family 39 protein [Anaerolineae bacterium]